MVVADNISSNAMVISWRVYGDEMVDYITLNYSVISTKSSCADSEQNMTIEIDGNSTHHTLGGLYGATEYSITVTATLEDGGSGNGNDLVMNMSDSDSVTINASTPYSG